MEDYKEELEASYRRILPGDMVTGTVIDITETDVMIDFNYYAPGRIPVSEMSDDPDYKVMEHVKIGDTLTASVIKTDDGAGNMLLSCREANEELVWDKLKDMMENKTVIHGKIGRHRQCRSDHVCGGCARVHPGIQTGSALCGRDRRVSGKRSGCRHH